ncbi:MAG: hypothetical protein WC959_02060 [Kiritimatiellales bacterium]
MIWSVAQFEAAIQPPHKKVFKCLVRSCFKQFPADVVKLSSGETVPFAVTDDVLNFASIRLACLKRRRFTGHKSHRQ